MCARSINWRIVFTTLFLFFSMATTEFVAQSNAESISQPAHDELVNGIEGSLVLTGESIPDEAFNAFLDFAKREKSRVVIVCVDGRNNDAVLDQTTRLMTIWQQRRGLSFQVVRVNKREAADTGPAKDAIDQATAVWLMADESKQAVEVLAGSEIDDACRRLLKRNGVIGTSRQLSSLLVDAKLEPVKEDAPPDTVFGYLRRTIVDFASDADEPLDRLKAELEQNPKSVGFRLAPGAALIVRGRRVFAAGATVRVRLAKSKAWPDYELDLEGRRRFADLSALRRFAVQRTQALFPPDKPGKPIVENGTLVIVGGGGMPKGLMNRFVESAGGKDASIVVIPISTPDPLPPDSRLTGWFLRAGAKKVTVLRGRTPATVNDAVSLKALKEATGIWFGGGRQWRFIDAYEGTEAAELMHDVLRRGGVIGGSSAGASIQGEYMARGNPLGSRDIMADGYERGLNFLPGVAIDQHFSQRKRQKDLTSLVDRYTQLLGIGIDESTAIVVTGRSAEVVGRHSVHFYDREKPVEAGKPDHESVHPGGKYDLVERKILEPGKPVKVEKKKVKKEKKEETAK